MAEPAVTHPPQAEDDWRRRLRAASWGEPVDAASGGSSGSRAAAEPPAIEPWSRDAPAVVRMHLVVVG